MKLSEKALWAKLKFLVLESAMMINDGYTDEEVIVRLLEIVELLDNTFPGGDLSEKNT